MDKIYRLVERADFRGVEQAARKVLALVSVVDGAPGISQTLLASQGGGRPTGMVAEDEVAWLQRIMAISAWEESRSAQECEVHLLSANPRNERWEQGASVRTPGHVSGSTSLGVGSKVDRPPTAASMAVVGDLLCIKFQEATSGASNEGMRDTRRARIACGRMMDASAQLKAWVDSAGASGWQGDVWVAVEARASALHLYCNTLHACFATGEGKESTLGIAMDALTVMSPAAPLPTSLASRSMSAEASEQLVAFCQACLSSWASSCQSAVLALSKAPSPVNKVIITHSTPPRLASPPLRPPRVPGTHRMPSRGPRRLSSPGLRAGSSRLVGR